MREITGERIPIKVWGEAVDEGTIAQTRNLANLPFAHHHVALLPDAHVGYGMPIGGVLAADGQVIPHAVGLDIGCGVCAWRTNVPAAEFREAADEVVADVQARVPTGFDWHSRSQEGRTDLFDDVPDSKPLRGQLERAKKQVGTLGGGNHFIEWQQDAEGVVWTMLHSGSRNLGKQMAEYYDRVARQENARTGSPVPPGWGLAHVPTDSADGAEYLAVMGFCLRFARENRRLMRETIQSAIERAFPGAEPDRPIDVHHNYAAVEEHFGREVVVHRKGAVRAVGDVVVPGSMGSASYIGRGLENAESFLSCSHGAGRAMSRRQARKSITVDEVLAEMEGKGIRLASKKWKDVPEEATGAYKDIEDVMGRQRDLVEPTVRLTPLAVVKA